MSRLTELIKHYAFMVEEFSRSYECITRNMKMDTIKIHNELCQRTDDTLEALKELQHYKDLEEAGRLIELPCKVGDTVYSIVQLPSHPNENGGMEEVYTIWKVQFGYNDLYHMGKWTFLTKEEAELKLKELKGE